MRRREFIAALAGTAASPLAARAQQVPRIGVLMSGDESDDIGQARVKTFQDDLARLGWNNGRNVQIDIRWGGVETQLRAQLATEVVSLRPDVLFAGGTPELIALRPARSIPTVFANVADPIGGGFVASLGRPGGNITGFMSVEPPIASKWLQLLKGIVPGLTRVSLLFNPEVDSYAGEFFRHAETAAVPLSVELRRCSLGEVLASALWRKDPDARIYFAPMTMLSLNVSVDDPKRRFSLRIWLRGNPAISIIQGRGRHLAGLNSFQGSLTFGIVSNSILASLPLRNSIRRM